MVLQEGRGISKGELVYIVPLKEREGRMVFSPGSYKSYDVLDIDN